MQDNQKQQEIHEYAAKVIKHTVRKLVGKAGYTQSDCDDLEQEMKLDLIARLPAFDAARGTYKTFVARVVERKLSNLIRHRSAEMRDYRRQAGSLNVQLDDGYGEMIEHSEAISKEECDRRLGKQSLGDHVCQDFNHDLGAIVAKLPEELRTLCEYLKSGTISDAARRMGIPRTTINDYVKKLRAIFADAGLENYF